MRLFWQAFGSYKFNIGLIVLLSGISSIFEGLGIGAIIPAFSFVTGGVPGSDPLSHAIQAVFAFIHLPYTFRFLIIFIGGLFILRALVLLVVQYISARIVSGYERDMRNRLFSSMVGARFAHLSHQKVGHLEQLLITNTSNTAQFLSFFSTLALLCTKLIMYMLVAVSLSLPSAVGSVLVGGAVLLSLLPLYARNRRINTGVELTHRELVHFVSQHVSGMKIIKAMALEQPVSAVASQYFNSIRKGSVDSSVLRGAMNIIIQFASIAFVGGIFALMYRSPGFSVAAFTVIVYAINQIFMQVQVGQNQLHAVGGLLPYMTAAYAYLEAARKEPEAYHGGLPFSFESEIEFRGVSFAYARQEEVLRGASFAIKRGDITGIVGSSGAGKTTLADLLLRLQTPSEGAITTDGVDIQKIGLLSWRTHVGYVPQDPFLLNDTIAHNIAFYTAVSRESIIAAARAADIHDFIQSLPHGYETRVDDRGSSLSGGQRQRVAIARALARQPEVLILDEPTSSLDPGSEQEIAKTLGRLRGSTTVIVIAHRPALASIVDRLVVLKDGRVTVQDKRA